jgi:hypothetical protein
MRRPRRGKIERPGENFAGQTHEMHDSGLLWMGWM